MRLTLPSWFKPSMSGNFHLMPDMTTNTGKLLGLCQLPASLNWSQIKAKGVTHQYVRGGSPTSELYDTYKHYSPQTTKTAAYNAGRGIVQGGLFNAQSIFTEELSEDGTLHFNDYPQLAPHWYKGMTDEMGNAAVKNRLYGGYSGGQNDVSVISFFRDNQQTIDPLYPAFRDGLDDAASAQKLYNLNNGSLNTMYFFNEVDGIKMSNIMGLMTGSYYSFMVPNLGAFCYSKFYEIQKKFAAGVRNTIMFTWTGAESPNLLVENPWSSSGWRVMRNDVEPNAYWRTIAHPNLHPSVALWNAVLGVFLTDGVIYWDSRRESYVDTPQHLEPAGFFPQFWHSNSAAEPSRQNPPKMSSFPWWQQDYALVANQWYAQCKPILDAGGQLRYFDYNSSINGDVAVNTSKTNDKRLFTETVKPYGQNTVLHLAASQRGLCFGAYANGRYFVVYFNPYLASNQSETITVNVNGNMVNIGPVKGKNVAVYVV